MDTSKELVDGFIKGLEASGPESPEGKKVLDFLNDLKYKGNYEEAATYISAMSEIFSGK